MLRLPPRSHTAHADASPHGITDMRLLLIDDNELDRMAIIRALSGTQKNIEIVEASTAATGLQCFDEGAFDAVLLDFRLPDMDGLDVLRQIRQHRDKHAAIIILTGADNELIEQECIEAGAQDFLLKQDVNHRHLTRSLLHASTRHIVAKRAAEQLHATMSLQSAILEGSGLSIIATDPNGLILSFNRAAERMLGYRSEEMVNRQTVSLIHQPEEVLARAEAIRQETGQPIEAGFEVFVSQARTGRMEEREWTYVRKDGSSLPICLSVTALHDLAGNISGFLGIASDISERKQREAEVQAALHEKETLLKEVYHRVKNNLQVVTSLFNLQQRSLPEGPARTSLKEGADRVRAMALVHEKLYQSASLSSIELGGYIGDLCAQLGMAADAGTRGIDFVTQVEQIEVGLELAVPLGLLLNELISNSLKHAFPDGQCGEIRVILRRVDNNHATLEVWDNGVGLGATQAPEQPASLGLRLVQTLSRQLDAELLMEQRAGAYSCIKFALAAPAQAKRSRLFKR